MLLLPLSPPPSLPNIIYLHQKPKYNDYVGNIRKIIAEGNAMSRTIQLFNNIHISGGLMPSTKKNYYLHY